MAEIKTLFVVSSLPGIKRDGTQLDGDNCSDGQWCRWQRGRPKKMGGFQRISNQLSGPIRDTLVWSRESLNAIYSFSPYGIEMLLVDNNGTGASIIDRTPAGWTTNDLVVWSTDTQYDDAVSSTGTVVLAHASSSLVSIDDGTDSKPFLAVASENGAFTEIADCPAVSGGIFSSPPYTIAHGSDGFVAWSDANQPQVWYTSSGNIGDAGADRITGAKIVKGLAVRSGSGPAAMLWSLDSVIRMDYVGGASIFRFTHLSTQSSILSQNSVIEYDGLYFWAGIDRFLMCDGARVYELPNDMNLNWFYDNLNFNFRQKVWAMKVPRYGEIWWFYPRGDATECTHAVIYNVREKTWYDTACARSSGFYSQVFQFPVMSDSNSSNEEQVLELSSVTNTLQVGDEINTVLPGSPSVAEQTYNNGAQGIITYVDGTTVRVHGMNNLPFLAGATLFDPDSLEQVLTITDAEDFTEGDYVQGANGAQGLILDIPTVNATALVNLSRYAIRTVGTTDYTLVGAANNLVGTKFTATGPATGTGTAVLLDTPVNITVRRINATAFANGGITDVTSLATDTITAAGATTTGEATIDSARGLYATFAHEKGRDAIEGDVPLPIESYFITADFGLPTGGAQPNQPQGLNRWTRLVRVEPNFIQEGEMSLEVYGKEFANAPEKVSPPYNFTNETQRIDMREQRREIRLKFSSNVVGGHYEMGRVIIHTEPGDVRS